MVELTGEGGRHSLHGSNEVINESYKDSEINLRTSLGSRSPLRQSPCIWSSQQNCDPFGERWEPGVP